MTMQWITLDSLWNFSKHAHIHRHLIHINATECKIVTTVIRIENVRVRATLKLFHLKFNFLFTLNT